MADFKDIHDIEALTDDEIMMMYNNVVDSAFVLSGSSWSNWYTNCPSYYCTPGRTYYCYVSGSGRFQNYGYHSFSGCWCGKHPGHSYCYSIQP